MSDRQVEVLSGTHLVVSTAGAVAIVAHRGTSRPSADSAAAKAVEGLRRLLRQAVEAEPGQPGRLFARLATRWIIEQDDDVEFGVLTPSGARLAVFLHGDVTAVLTGADGEPDRLCGTDAGFTVDRVVDAPAMAAALFVDAADAECEFPVARGVGSLTEGVVPGAGVVIWSGRPRGDRRQPADPSESETAGVEQIVAAPDPPAPLELAAPLVSDRIDVADEQAPPRPSLPVPIPGSPPSDDPGLLRDTELEATPVRGHNCKNMHLNDPRAAFCCVCGIRMDQMTQVLTEGVRPPLGFLVLDDGTTYVLDGDCVLGRDPEKSELAAEGLRAIRIDDSSGGMSRAHAAVRLMDWDVTIVDLDSTNGTHLRAPGEQDWIRLPPNTPVTLTPGAEVRLGDRVATFDSPHGRL
ncbi:FHA domain-containing protein [Rhodococcus sp. NPDC058514]|uniref:FHA domain-containing protein n=1 Tax=Rhodococcus sp. NPDC058514 TaxID=3346532 RepID=UPI003665B8A3